MRSCFAFRRPARLAAVLLLGLAGCSGDDRGTHGHIVGDAYLVPGLGEAEVNLAGLTVHLIEEPIVEEPVERLDSVLSNVCVQRERFLERLLRDTVGLGEAGRDTFRVRAADAYSRAWRARNRILQGLVRRTTTTDPRSQFVLDSIVPGEYRLWADTVLGEEHITWLARVEIEAGDSMRLNLSTGNLDMNPFRCVAP